MSGISGDRRSLERIRVPQFGFLPPLLSKNEEEFLVSFLGGMGSGVRVGRQRCEKLNGMVWFLGSKDCVAFFFSCGLRSVVLSLEFGGG